MNPATRKLVTRISSCALIALFTVLTPCSFAAPKTFSLSGNWSDAHNPNGPWSYRQGSTILKSVNPWDGAGTAFVGCKQPAWAPSDTAGDFLPAIMKVNACSAEFLNSLSSPASGTRAGDIVVHTVDGGNGNPALGLANILFKLPVGNDGRYQISGMAWDATLDEPGRPQTWKILVNGTQRTSGYLNAVVPRAKAETFNIAVDLVAGDTVQLAFETDAGSGYFVGANMTITPVECFLQDALTFDESTGFLTMKFNITTLTTTTWNGWLIEKNTVQPLWSQAVAASEPFVTETKTHAVSKSGGVGILSTLTTATGGVVCSNVATVNTGTP